MRLLFNTAKGKKMIKRLLIPAFLAIMLVGCAVSSEQGNVPPWQAALNINDPNSILSKAVAAIDVSAHAIKETAPAAGPYGWVAGALATVVASATGLYKVRQKNQTIAQDGKIITAQQQEFGLIRDTTKAIVSAIEEVGKLEVGNAAGSTISAVVKVKVAEELHKRKLDTMGKAIISGMKAARIEEAQKMQ